MKYYKRIKTFFDRIFDILMIVVTCMVTFSAILYLIRQFTVVPLPDFFDVLKINKVISTSLQMVVMIKLYKLLVFFIGDHRIELANLLEIGITALIIETIFGHEIEIIYREGFLLIFLIAFFIVKYGKHKGWWYEDS